MIRRAYKYIHHPPTLLESQMLLNDNTGDPLVDLANREAAQLLIGYVEGDDAGMIKRLTSAALDPEHLVRISVALLAAVRELLLVSTHPNTIGIYTGELRDRFGLDK